MAFRDTWHRALVYFGLAEDHEYQEPDLYDPDTGTQGELYDAPASRSASVSPIRRRRARDEIDDIFADDEPVGSPRTRSLRLPSGLECVVTDTVGFIRKLPKDLFLAFRSTFEEACDADLLLRGVDVSDPALDVHAELPSPSGRWLVASGGIQEGDYVWRSIWIVDRERGEIVPIAEGASAAMTRPDAAATLSIAGESTLEWLPGSPEVLVVDQTLWIPGTGLVPLGGRLAR